MRAWRLDCLRGLGFGVASSGGTSSCATANGEMMVDSAADVALLTARGPGRLRFELADAGRVMAEGVLLSKLGVNGPVLVIEFCL